MESLKETIKQRTENFKNLEPEFAEVIEENFWDLIITTGRENDKQYNNG